MASRFIHRSSIPALVGSIAAALTLASSASAQPPSNWSTITLPPTQTTNQASIGTTVVFQSTGHVHLYSGVTKEWTVLPIASVTSIFQANDYVIVRDGSILHGYASHTGKVDTIFTNGNPTIVSGPASSSWVTLVAEGTQAWGFSGFNGVWVPLTLSQPDPTMISNRLIGLLKDGSTVYGFNAHWGTFVPVAADPSANLAVVGEAEVATAHSATVFRAFSAQQNTWGVANVPSTANQLQQNEFALVWNGTSVVAYSGISGTFDTYTASAPVTSILGAEAVAGFIDGPNVVSYGSGRGTFETMPASNASLFFDYNFLFVTEPTGVTPFSGLLCAYGAKIGGTYSIASNDDIGWADGATTDYAYSPILNTWIAAPAVATIGGPVLVRNSVVLPHATGYEALSARHGTWVSQATSLPANFLAPASGSTFLAFDNSGTAAHVFDARLNRWATIQGQAPLTAKISRHTAMAHDGQFGYGFGQASGEWDVVPLTGPPSMDTASSIGTIKHGGDLSVYSVLGSLSYIGRFPEFTQAINLGNTLRLYQVAPAGSSLILLLGLQPARIDLGLLLGKLYIDPSFLLTYPLATTVGPDGLLVIDLPLPANQPSLIGLQPQLQNVVFPPGGATPWLTTSVAPVLF